MLDKIWNDYDKDEDGTLTFDEMKDFFRKTFAKIKHNRDANVDSKEPTEEELKKAFDEYDSNGNGLLEKSEMKRYVYDLLQIPLEYRTTKSMRVGLDPKLLVNNSMDAEQSEEEDMEKTKDDKVAMSLVMLEVKPFDADTDLDEMASKIFSEVTQDGLFWKTEYKKEPLAFGIFKLIIAFSCEDEKVSVDAIVEQIVGYEELVQSCEIQAFNKI